MYNDLMPESSHEIRVCTSCGLRYPLTLGHSFGTRCPICMGETGVTLRVSRRLTPAPRPRPTPFTPQVGKETAVLLDNIRSAWNVGSIFRSAEGFGFRHAYICGITPTPENDAVTKTSLGAEEMLTWSYHKDAVKLVRGLKREGWEVFALEEDKRALALGSSRMLSRTQRTSNTPRILIVGNEVTGVDPGLLEQSDEILYIPMQGQKKSFNVAIAFGIAAYALNGSPPGIQTA